MIISRKKFEAEVQKRVEEAVKKVDEYHWRKDREHELHRELDYLGKRLIELEKKNGIDHPSHHRVESVCAGW